MGGWSRRWTVSDISGYADVVAQHHNNEGAEAKLSISLSTRILPMAMSFGYILKEWGCRDRDSSAECLGSASGLKSLLIQGEQICSSFMSKRNTLFSLGIWFGCLLDIFLSWASWWSSGHAHLRGDSAETLNSLEGPYTSHQKGWYSGILQVELESVAGE